MTDVLGLMGISCARCRVEPIMMDYLGCGKAPTAEHRWDKEHWTETSEGELLSPFARVQRGMPAFEGIGYGPVRDDWEFCPLWYCEHSDFTVLHIHPALAFQRLAKYRDSGSLQYLVPPRATSALVDGLDLVAILEKTREAEMHEEMRLKAGGR